MRAILTIVDDFLLNPDEVRELAIQQGFETREFEGVPYHTVNINPSVAILSQLAELYGRPVNIHVQAFRQGRLNSPLHNLVHSDNSCSEIASVLYLNPIAPHESGTAFWRHRATGWEHQPTEEQLEEKGLTIQEFCRDWHKADAWDRIFLARSKYNRLITYPTTAFHSRWPWSGFGKTDEEARLIHAAFFNVL